MKVDEFITKAGPDFFAKGDMKMGRIICPLCEHYSTCKYWEVLIRLDDADMLFFARNHNQDDEFRKWRERFARFCEYFRLDEANLEYLMASGLDFIYHDFVYRTSDLKSSLSTET